MASQFKASDRPLVLYLREQYGPGKRFKSARQFSLEAGRNPGMIATIEESGHATAEVLIDIARALGESPVKLFILAGWLDPEGVGITLSSQDRHLIEKWRRLPHRDQEVLERMISGLLETTDE